MVFDVQFAIYLPTLGGPFHLMYTPPCHRLSDSLIYAPVDEIFLRGFRTLNFRRGYHLEISEGVENLKIAKGGQYFSKIPMGLNSIFVNFG